MARPVARAMLVSCADGGSRPRRCRTRPGTCRGSPVTGAFLVGFLVARHRPRTTERTRPQERRLLRGLEQRCSCAAQAVERDQGLDAAAVAGRGAGTQARRLARALVLRAPRLAITGLWAPITAAAPASPVPPIV